VSYHVNLTLSPAGSYGQVVPTILARAADDLDIVQLDRGPLGIWLVFLRGSDDLEGERQRIQEYQAVDPSDSILRIFCEREQKHVVRYWMALSQEGEPVTRQHMVEFVKWILREFAPCRVFDGDTSEDLSTLAVQTPEQIFLFEDL
jgi:hypothetical protein